jgi:hypothetical protein
MAKRPLYLPKPDLPELVSTLTVEFEWHPGFALVQKQKSIQSLHNAAREVVRGNLLEISGKSPDKLGRCLSAFSLLLKKDDWPLCPVECAFQGSKVFENGGPFTDLYMASAWEAKKDARLKSSGNLVAFSWRGEDWPIKPRTCFYDWLYINALNQNQELAELLIDFEGFTDIEFNPAKSINCQAHSAALYVALIKSGQLESIIASKETLKSLSSYTRNAQPVQGLLI